MIFNKLKDATSTLTDFIQSCELAYPPKGIIISAFQSDFRDKEDALQYFTAVYAEADYFITRNVRDYKSSKPILPVMDVQNFLKHL